MFLVKYSLNKQQYSLFWVYNRPTSDGTLMHMLYFGEAFDLNENYILVISNSNYNKASMTKYLCVKMATGAY